MSPPKNGSLIADAGLIKKWIWDLGAYFFVNIKERRRLNAVRFKKITKSKKYSLRKEFFYRLVRQIDKLIISKEVKSI
ncbi:MAG: hypothetical protein DRH06_02795 [Deltaproteobacteria bacterium]|nr:MAG: hypothetical protein DRH06_02795 [Deltaproteobacteria bacterium]